MEGYVRIGQEPSIRQGQGRWNEPEPYYYVNGYAYVTTDLWERLKEFIAPYDFSSCGEPGSSGFEEKARAYINRKIQISGQMSTVWQFNARLPTDNGDASYVRMFASLASDALTPIRVWTDWDVYVTYPLLQMKAREMNANPPDLIP